MTHRTARAARFLLGGLLVAILVSLSGCYGYGRYAVYDDQYGYFPYDYYPYGFYPYGISRTDHHFHGDRLSIYEISLFKVQINRDIILIRPKRGPCELYQSDQDGD